MSVTNAESQPIAIVSLQMEDGIEEIKVYEGEDVELEVELFCQRYKLGNDCLEYLVNQIKQQLKREPSPRFADFNKQQFLNKGSLQTRSSKQSDFGLVTSASSDENQVSAQKSYEEWQKKINRKVEANSNSKMQWNLPTSVRCKLFQQVANDQNNPRSINTNDKLYGETNAQHLNMMEQKKQNYIYKGQSVISETTPKSNISPNFKSIIQQKKKVDQNSLLNIANQTQTKGEEQQIKKQQQFFQLQKEQSSLRSFQPRRSDISSRNHSQQNRSTSNKKQRSSTPVNENPYYQEKERKQQKFEHLKQEFQKMYSKPQINNLYQKEENKKQTQQQQVKKLFTDQIERMKKIEQKQREQSIQNNSKFQIQNSKEQIYQKPYNKQDQEDLRQIELKQNNRSTSNLSQRSDSRTQINNSKTNQFDLNIKTIFKSLDGDKDGYISKDKLNLSGLEVELLELVSEALYKIEEEDIVADQIQFKRICESVGLQQVLNHQLI